MTKKTSYFYEHQKYIFSIIFIFRKKKKVLCVSKIHLSTLKFDDFSTPISNITDCVPCYSSSNPSVDHIALYLSFCDPNHKNLHPRSNISFFFFLVCVWPLKRAREKKNIQTLAILYKFVSDLIILIHTTRYCYFY